MKTDSSLHILVEPGEIKAYVRNLWQTPEFQKSHDEGGFVAEVVNDYAWLPRFFFEASDKELETAHFSTWWSGIQRRTYPNPYIHDLYLLHEMRHAGKMTYVENLEFSNFKRKMEDNEDEASLSSEIRIYYEIPGLRAKAFPYEIYADRFLKDPAIQARWNQDPARLIEELGLRRRNVKTSQTPNDMAEYWIRKFTYQNDAWMSLWSHRYNLVEAAMVRLRDGCAAGDRAGAMKRHMEWLLSPAIAKGKNIPFPGEAKAMAGIYWQNKSIYEEEHAKAAAKPVIVTPPAPPAAPSP